MDSQHEEEQLKRAIEVSRLDTRMVLDNDDEEARFEEDIKRAIEESKKTAQMSAAAPVHNVEPTSSSASAASAFLSQRAQDERARLERLKRRRPDIDPGVSQAVDDSDEEIQEILPRGAKRQHISSASRDGARRANAYISASSSNPAPTPSTSRAAGQRPNVSAANEGSGLFWDGDASLKAILPNWIRTTPFLRNGFGCMHMKFMLLFYKTGRLRVIVSTANLVEYDWRDIENSVWVQDIPKRPEPITSPANTEDFAAAMVRVLHALNVAPALVNHLNTDHPNLPLKRLEHLRSHWDFSRVKAALVPSLAGKHEGWPKVILTGHTRLMKAVMDMGAATPEGKELVLECQGSSIGNYSTMWMNEFYKCARGESPQKWLEMTKARRSKTPYPPVKILYPTAQYVRESVLGEAGGGTMFCRRKQWEGANFPRNLFHQSRSKRGRVLMHSKMILGTFQDKQGTLDSRQRASTTPSDSGGSEREDGDDDGDKEPLVGWLYVGSHNFTPSAWGTLSGSGFSPVLNINNYELGIVLPLRNQEEIDRLVCWERPPPKYAAGRDEPWIQTESAVFVEDA
ncbi:hypothetical protein ONZ51_g9818 [Trametes cubensis]|uniref:Phospholipase D/nuclease n=1 Tax=Trametes cubensis TaxID=1111947 RepID=A0AAD7TL42_9APHY|nr:hypothetical protein ONZ51_g9818 [Trametes cubensis]